MAILSSRATLSLGLAIGLATAVGCGSKGDEAEAETTDPSSGEDDTSGGGEDESTSTDPSVGDDGSSSSTDPSEGEGFISPMDGSGVNTECNIWTQDCPSEEKCMPWANDGGNSWNATKCTPLDPNPAQPGDSCTVEGSGVSGVDNCDVSAMCWNVDGETNMGTCVGFCEGTEATPTCSDPEAGCSVSNEGVLILCLPFCDPLIQNCAGDNEACYPEENGFFCSPDASGPDEGNEGDPCEFLNVCKAGLFCAIPEGVPNCNAGGCCSPFCDTSDPNPAADCLPSQECVAYYEPGTEPPGYETVGVCLIPTG